MTRFPQQKYEGLVERILAGEVVFFVGAGFSQDSEGNSAQRLIARLIVRFMAATQELPKAGVTVTEDLRRGLRLTFKLDDADDICSEKTIDKLAARYYDINDWITNAFEALYTAALAEAQKAGEAVDPANAPQRAIERMKGFAKPINAAENQLLAQLKIRNKTDPVPLEPIDPDGLSELRAGEYGKAIFLETLGFCHHAIMAGQFDDTTFEKVMGDFRGLVRDRHRVIARLAREGLCPLLITTNYDLLLEGASRLAGFQVPGFGGAESPDVGRGQEPLATFSRLTRVAAPSDFFESGGAYRSAMLVKIHGCADRFRLEKRKRQLSAYLPSIVFTYREIQNWRKDSWSRDLVSTLLRTRTMVLCGYSGADPVLHDTFRTVYEEIRSQDSERRAQVKAGKVRAYFTGSMSSREFHGIEILRAASRAAGIDTPSLTDHENYLPFFFLSENKFPSLDEMMTWVGHLTTRGLQKNALQTSLRRVASQLLLSPVPECDLEIVRKRFDELVNAEKTVAEQWSDEGAARWEFGRIAGWTDRFHTALLREFALAESVQSNQGPGLAVERLRAARCYYPISDQPGWAAWGVVIEIAIRRVLCAIRGDGEWRRDHRFVEPAISEYPAVLFSMRDARQPSPVCLLIRFASFERPGYEPEIRGVYKSLTIWDLVAGVEPRQTGASNKRFPSAGELWKWAIAADALVTNPKEVDCARRWFS